MTMRAVNEIDQVMSLTHKRKVLLVLENAGGGTGRHVVDLAAGLIGMGWSVDLLYSTGRLEAWFEREIAAIPDLKLHVLDMAMGISWTDLRAAAGLRRFIRSKGPFDIVHGHSSKGGALARIAAAATGAAVIYTPHALYTLDPKLSRTKRRIFAALERNLARLTRAVICVSRAEFNHAREIGIPVSKLRLITNGIDVSGFGHRINARRQMALNDDEFCIGHVGRLAPQKAVHVLIEAFAAVRAQCPSARLVIVGDGPDRRALELLAARSSHAEAIQFLGARDGRLLMPGFDVFALTSHYEGFPYVLLEAAVSGVPIVMTDVGGGDELVESGITKVARGAEELVEQLKKLYDNAVASDRERIAIGRRAAERFSLQAMINQTCALYESLLARTV